MKKLTKLTTRKKDPNSKYWRTKADQGWSKAIRKRDGCCLICGKVENIQAHHIINRSVRELRYSLDNGIALCPKCHKYNNICSAHKGSFLFCYAFWEKRLRQAEKLLKSTFDLQDSEYNRNGGGKSYRDVVRELN